ncbi:hypothetical protein E4N83_03920 [Treponema denticola]|uniref:hypothetical protein n=1 Tax=Treponema denticola TaxID=158 RepID=UPI0020A4A1C7|nr:hypothetical protein [Treponema denticola]UTC94923.1 hypothetical protein E4N85_03870 [Treponema denticola]UTC97441.1 hypothetical protein E4N83_03920 [Treponema denticola]
MNQKDQESRYKITRKNEGDIFIAEIPEIEFSIYEYLDFVIMYFCYNNQTHNSVEQLIDKYRSNGFETCIIGCIKSLDEVIDYTDDKVYSSFKNLTSKFDLHLDSATDFDFENLIQFCISTEIGNHMSVSPHDMKYRPDTKIQVISVEADTIQNLISVLKTKTNYLFKNNSAKCNRFMISAMTKDKDFEDGIHAYEQIYEAFCEAFDEYIVEADECLLVGCTEMPDVFTSEKIKVILIFCDK